MPNAGSYEAAQRAAAGLSYSGYTGHLATIDSAAEYRFLSWILRARNAYISGSDASGDGAWVLTDGPNSGQPALFLPWAFGEPNRGTGQACLALASTDGVMDVNCATTNMDYVVEFDRMSECIHQLARSTQLLFILQHSTVRSPQQQQVGLMHRLCLSS